jgi:hypothetical protein
VSRRAGALVGTSIAAMVVACTSFSEPPSSSPDAGVTDGGPGTTDATEAGGGCAPKPSGCASPLLLHQLDFVSSSLPPSQFAPDVSNGTVTHSATGHTCTPGALRATVNVPGEAGSTGNATVARRVDGTFTSGRLAFAFRGPKPVTSGYANFGCTLTVRPQATPNVRTATRLALAGDRLLFGGSTRDENDVSVGGVGELDLDDFVADDEVDKWHTFDASLAIVGPTLKVTLTFDGKAFAPVDLLLLDTVGRVSVDCGIIYAEEPGASYVVDIDDVLVELCP